MTVGSSQRCNCEEIHYWQNKKKLLKTCPSVNYGTCIARPGATPLSCSSICTHVLQLCSAGGAPATAFAHPSKGLSKLCPWKGASGLPCFHRAEVEPCPSSTGLSTRCFLTQGPFPLVLCPSISSASPAPPAASGPADAQGYVSPGQLPFSRRWVLLALALLLAPCRDLGGHCSPLVMGACGAGGTFSPCAHGQSWQSNAGTLDPTALPDSPGAEAPSLDGLFWHV